MKKIIYFSAALTTSLLSNASFAKDYASCLTSAYPQVVSVLNNQITFKNGNQMPIGNRSTLPFTQRINHASVADQLSQTYNLDFNIPEQYEDAGRIRNDVFFKNLYGSSQSAVKKNIVSVPWKPSKSKVAFNRLNNAAKQLEKVGNEIALKPELARYVSKSLGTFNYRVIAGTNRLSAHSFGVAIDFKLPKPLHKYWRWDGCKSEDTVCPYPKQLISDPKLNEVVQIFEKHGFIWGGKWASYDSVHFEYRPELLIPQCRS